MIETTVWESQGRLESVRATYSNIVRKIGFLPPKKEKKAIGKLKKNFRRKEKSFTLRSSYCSRVNKPEDKACKTCTGNFMDCAV